MVETQAPTKGSSDQIQLFFWGLMNQAGEENTQAERRRIKWRQPSSVLDVGHMESQTQASALRLIYASYQETPDHLFLAHQMIKEVDPSIEGKFGPRGSQSRDSSLQLADLVAVFRFESGKPQRVSFISSLVALGVIKAGFQGGGAAPAEICAEVNDTRGAAA